MAKFREKWVAALAFAILLHVGMFFIFYINHDENKLKYSTDDKNNNAAHLTLNNLDKKQTLVEYSASITTLDATKSSLEITHLQKENLESSKQSVMEEPEKKPLTSQKTIENKMQSETINTQNLQEQNKEMAGKPIKNTEAFFAENVNELGVFKKDLVVIKRDMPKQESSVSTDNKYESINGELEEITNQLSEVINEVKRRNQQQIDQTQTQQTRTYESFE